jgi:hypothetical protein
MAEAKQEVAVTPPVVATNSGDKRPTKEKYSKDKTPKDKVTKDKIPKDKISKDKVLKDKTCYNCGLVRFSRL